MMVPTKKRRRLIAGTGIVVVDQDQEQQEQQEQHEGDEDRLRMVDGDFGSDDRNDRKHDDDEEDEDLFAVSTDDESRMKSDKTSTVNGHPPIEVTPAESKANGSTINVPKINPDLHQHAKGRLSKFAARLFESARPKGLVDTPEIVPLNDEFLVAFGRREKEFDKARGLELDFDHGIDSGDEEGGNDRDGDDVSKMRKKKSESEMNNPIAPKKGKSMQGFKVRIANLAYRTTEDTLTKACIRFGTLSEINLLLDDDMVSTNTGNQSIHNSGLAYVTFDTEDGAQSCIDGLKTLDGRPLRVSLAVTRQKNSSDGGSRATLPANSASLLSIVFTKDISTICFRCGQVGHRESDCVNPAKPKPCSLCGNTDHEQRGCPNNKICFNCGCPGHVSRDCQYPRGSLPRRMVCGTCLQPGHHTMQCQLRSEYEIPARTVADAVCMVCGRVGRGFMCCKSLRWFFGLKGLSCFNCGMQGHSGYDCQRPSLYQCMQDSDLTIQEIERAEQISIEEDLQKQRQKHREVREQLNRKRDRGEGDSNRNRSNSLPPQRIAGQQNHRQLPNEVRGSGSSNRHSSGDERGKSGNVDKGRGSHSSNRRGY